MAVLKRPRNHEFLLKTLQISKNKCHSLPLFSFLLSLWLLLLLLSLLLFLFSCMVIVLFNKNHRK